MSEKPKPIPRKRINEAIDLLNERQIRYQRLCLKPQPSRSSLLYYEGVITATRWAIEELKELL